MAQVYTTHTQGDSSHIVSHQFDVTSGSFMAPGLPNAAERPLLQKLVNTYGKQWNLWNVSRGDALPCA